MIKQLEEIKMLREKNNELWCGILEIALKHPEGQALLKKIRELDRQITKRMEELIDE